MAALSVNGVGATTYAVSLLGAKIGRRLRAAKNLRPPVLLHGAGFSGEDIKFSAVSVQARAPEFRRRFIRVQVNPRSNELATIRSVPVQVARELINAGHRYLDVRTAEEFTNGHVEGAVNVPYLKNVGGGMTKNLHFVEEVTRVFHKDDELVVGCQSGRRSLMAAAELQAAEFTAITDMVGGHTAWVESGLPTSV